MGWTAAQFKATYPEFRQVPDDSVTSVLSYAAGSLRPDLFGAELDTAVGLLAADALAMRPYGQPVRLKADAGRSVYWVQYERLARAKCGGPHLARTDVPPGGTTTVVGT